MGKLLSFIQAIEQSGANNRERARRLGISERTITEYLAGRNIKQIRWMARHPSIVEALLDDALHGRWNGDHHTDESA